MADTEQPTGNPNNASRTDVPHLQIPGEQPGHDGTSVPVVEGSNRDDYMHELEDEVINLREFKRRTEATSSQPQIPGFGTVPFVQSNKKCSFKTFMASKPPEFSGSTNPSVTLNWLRDMERKFDVTHCEDEYKVSYAIQCLKDEAMVWWDSITGHLTNSQKESIRWPDFHNAVCNQYCSDFEMARIRREFVNLQLTDKMTIDDLIAQFTEKLRFVHEWVPNEKTRIEQFVDALPSNYRTTVRLAGTLSQAFNLARSVDSDMRGSGIPARDISSQKAKSESSGKGKQRWSGNRQGQKSGSKSGSSGGSNWCNSCRSRHAGQCTPQTNKCLKCGELGHEIKNCRFPNFVCWTCKKEGHRVGQCPEAGKQGSVSVGSSASSGQKRKNPPPAVSRAFQMTVDEAVHTEDVITDPPKDK